MKKTALGYVSLAVYLGIIAAAGVVLIIAVVVGT